MPAADADPERLALRGPLPGGARFAQVTFKANWPGVTAGDRVVRRSVATHANVDITHDDGTVESRRLERDEVEAFLAEAARLQAGGARDG